MIYITRDRNTENYLYIRQSAIYRTEADNWFQIIQFLCFELCTCAALESRQYDYNHNVEILIS